MTHSHWIASIAAMIKQMTFRHVAVKIHDIIKIVTAVFEKITVLFLGAPVLEQECPCSLGTDL
jgi:hypothetical protein